MELPATLEQALSDAADRLSKLPKCWLLGGSCGLLLQQVALSAEPRDIDIYTDECHVAKVHSQLEPYCTSRPEQSKTPIYQSVLSRYIIRGKQAELVGGFRIETVGSIYRVEVDTTLSRYAVTVSIGNGTIRLMPLAHELVFNVLRNRPDRYVPIAQRMISGDEVHLEALRLIVARNEFRADVLDRIHQLINVSQ